MRVPCYSQHLDTASDQWKQKVCGIASLKMVLEYHKPDAPSIDELIDAGLKLDGYIEGIGWKHAALASLAHQHALTSSALDWWRDDPNAAFQKLLPYLTQIPVMASIYKNFDPTITSGHIVVLTDIINDTIYYHDPDAHTRKDIPRRVHTSEFLKGWKRRIIVVHNDHTLYLPK